MNLRFLFALIFVSGFAHSQADEQWWFDVEVILFDRSLSLTELEEQFTFADNLRPVQTELDVISDLLHPQINHLKQSLPVCGKYHELYLTAPPSLNSILQDHERWKLLQAPNKALSVEYQDQQESGELTDRSTGKESNLLFTQNKSEQLNQHQDYPSFVTSQDIARIWLEYALPAIPAKPSIPKMRFCRDEKPWLSWENGRWKWHREDNSMPYPDEISIELNGEEKSSAHFAHILPESARELTKLSQQIRQARGLNRLLHITWRQQVKFGNQNAEKVRLFAGNDYSDQFTLTGDAISDDFNELVVLNAGQTEGNQDRFFEELQRQLSNPKAVPFASMMAAVKDNKRKANQDATTVSDNTHIPIWKLDGYMKVYLKYINRVPYLHIESELFYRQPIPLHTAQKDIEDLQYRLVSVPFQQKRRVISNQLHYFDHPLFGMVVQIRRHQLPLDDEK